MLRQTIVIALLCIPALGWAQISNPARDVSLTKGTATIRGRVVDAKTGRPLRGVTLSVYASDRVGRSALTGADGRYEFKSLPAGRYRLNARTDGYVALDYGQTRPAQGGRPVILVENQITERVDFSLPLGGAIAGVLRDELGDPLAGVQVRAMRPIYRDGRRVLILDQNAFSFTNDLGEFRVFGLSPGPYQVTVLAPVVVGAPGVPIENTGAGTPPTYYPGSANFAEAQRLMVKLGETINNVNLTLQTLRNASIRGNALDGEGRPLANPRFMVSQIGPGVLYGFSTTSREDGTFTAGNLAPGDYDVRVTGVSSTPERIPLVAIAKVNLKAGEVLDLPLTAVPMSTGTGRVVASDGAAPLFPAASATFQVEPVVAIDAVPYQAKATSGPSFRPQSDFTFTVSSPPGRAMFLAPTLPRGWYLKAVRVNGMDISDTGIEFPAGGTVSGIQVELTNRPSEISGTVRGAKGEIVDDYSVLIFAQNPERRKGITRYFSTARPDATGQFTVLGLPAGDYYAIALDYADPDVSADPDFLDPLSRNATAFTLVDGQPKILDLTLVP